MSTTMEKTLKEQNLVALRALFLANIAGLIFVVKQEWIRSLRDLDVQLKWVEGLSVSLHNLTGVSLLLTLSYFLTELIQGLISSDNKARIVFLRLKNYLPGCRAFSYYAKNNSLIDVDKLRKINKAPLPRLPSNQNKLWFTYSIEARVDPISNESHKKWLLCRDWTWFALLFFIVGFSIFCSGVEYTFLKPYLCILLFQLMATWVAARTYAKRFVVNVMKWKCHHKIKKEKTKS
jgi:hypothetical protein